MSKSAASFEDLPYRDCAGVVVFNSLGQVFVGKRRADKSDPTAHLWQFPQGGIDADEEPIDAALRELYEETSITSISILTSAPNWISYDLPPALLGKALKGKYRGQRQKWFAVLFEGSTDEINVLNPADGAHPAEFSDWKWVDLAGVSDLIVPFKRAAYEAITAAFADIPRQLAGSQQ